MHVLLATTGYPPEHAGAGGRLHQMYSRLAAQDDGFSWGVVTKQRETVSATVAGPRRIAAFERGREEFPPALENLAELRWMWRQLHAGLLDNIDLVHAAGWSWYTPLLLWAARRRRIPILRELTTPGDPGGASPGGRLVRWTNRLATAIVAISPALAAQVQAVLPASIPVWCRPNGIDLARFCPPSQDQRAIGRAALKPYFPDLAADDIVILHVGRVRPLKNQVFLADCVAGLPHRYKLLLVGPAYSGDDSYGSALRQRLQADDLAGRAVWTDAFSDTVPMAMQAADIFAFPSTMEGLGTVMLEALCTGLPVVASHLPGITDWVVRAGCDGYLAPLQSEIFRARLLQATELCRGRGGIAAGAATRFDQSVIDHGYVDLFRRLTSPAAR